jgi:CubicO group peptidase (beta-lactamase class C family)
MRALLPLLFLLASASYPAAAAPALEALHGALERLSREGEFSGAVVIRGRSRLLFAKAYGAADPLTGRPFQPGTPVDSGSLAKPITAAAVLLLARHGRVDLDAPVTRYLPEFPHPQTTIRHLLAHSAGLPGYEPLEPLANKTNKEMLLEIGRRNLRPAFAPGSRFSYCNTCYNSLALLIERVTGRPYLDFVQRRLSLPATVTIRPRALGEWPPGTRLPARPGRKRRARRQL